jgi:hypothetical protein
VGGAFLFGKKTHIRITGLKPWARWWVMGFYTGESPHNTYCLCSRCSVSLLVLSPPRRLAICVEGFSGSEYVLLTHDTHTQLYSPPKKAASHQTRPRRATLPRVVAKMSSSSRLAPGLQCTVQSTNADAGGRVSSLVSSRCFLPLRITQRVFNIVLHITFHKMMMCLEAGCCWRLESDAIVGGRGAHV